MTKTACNMIQKKYAQYKKTRVIERNRPFGITLLFR